MFSISLGRRIWLVLLSALWVASLASGQEMADEQAVVSTSSNDEISLDEPSSATDTTELGPSPAQVVVEDHLTTLSDEELAQICADRGFQVAEGEDLLEAARKCISLEDEMNAVLAKHPELAAELDKEIARLETTKEILESENQELLEEVVMLQAQLEQAGMDTAEYKKLLELQQQQQTRVVNAANMTAGEVFQESLIQLYHKVKQDVLFVGKVASPVLKPTMSALRLSWKYAQPVVGQALEQAKVVGTLVWKQVEPYVGDKVKDVWKQAEPVVRKVVSKVVVKGKELVTKFQQAVEPKPMTDTQEAR